MGFAAALAPVFSIASTALSFLGQQGESSAVYAGQKAELEYQMKQEATEAANKRIAAQSEAEKIRKAADKQRKAARSAFAVAGVDVDKGTPNTINDDIFNAGEEDALTTIINGNLSARANEDNYAAYGTQKSGLRKGNKYGGASALLSIGSGVASNWKTITGE